MRTLGLAFSTAFTVAAVGFWCDRLPVFLFDLVALTTHIVLVVEAENIRDSYPRWTRHTVSAASAAYESEAQVSLLSLLDEPKILLR